MCHVYILVHKLTFCLVILLSHFLWDIEIVIDAILF